MADPARRGLLRAAGLMPLTVATAAVAVAGPAATPAAPVAPSGVDARALADDDAYWARVAALYEVARDPIPLENGFWGVMARPVLDAYLRHTERVNREGAAFARAAFPRHYRVATQRAARALGVGDSELALTRNATEALQALIGGYNRLAPGDAVLCADVDYDSMLTAMHWLRQRRGVEVVELALPEPTTHQGILDAYAQAIERHPRLRMMLLTQVSHRHGLRLPVPEIAAMARRHGIAVILDAAHGMGQLDVRLADQGVDYAGVNFHKWYGAPLGVGGLYIRQGRAADIDPYMGEPDPHGAVHARVHTGTVNFAAAMALPDALDLHEAIGEARKRARLLALSERWLEGARRAGAFDVLAPPDPRLRSAIAAFRLRGQATPDANRALAARLRADYGIQAVHRDGLASGSCVRVTPAVFTRPGEIDRLVAALQDIAATA